MAQPTSPRNGTDSDFFQYKWVEIRSYIRGIFRSKHVAVIDRKTTGEYILRLVSEVGGMAEAAKWYSDKTLKIKTLTEIDVRIKMIQFELRCAEHDKEIPRDKFTVVSPLIVVAGRILGAWLAAVRGGGSQSRFNQKPVPQR